MLITRAEGPHSGRHSFVSRIIDILRLARGQKNERRALELCAELYAAGLIPHIPGILPCQTGPYSELDRLGVDILFPVVIGADTYYLYLQVKSSLEGRRKFVQKGRKHSRLEIPCVVVNDEISDAAVREEIRKACWREYYRLEDRLKQQERA